MAKEIFFEGEARAKIQAGVNKLADAVRITLGPKGKLVILQKGDPVFTLDGVTVANDIKLKDKVEAMGAELVKSVAQRTNDQAGDGTTTATILSQSLLNEGLKGVAAGVDPIRIKKGIEDGAKVVLAQLKEMARPIKTKSEMSDVATISSRDRTIGDTIAGIFEEIGKDGVVTVEESKQVGMWSETVEGMQIDSGWISPYFMTNPERQEAVVEEPYVLVTAQVISTNQDIVNILTRVAESDKKAIVIVADNVTGEALQTLVINKMRGVLKCVVVKAPGYGEQKTAFLEDIATLTGAKVISEELGKKVEDAVMEDLGRCGRFLSYRTRSVFVDGKGNKKEITTRTKLVKSQLDDERSDFKRTILEKRYARMSGGVAVIKVGSVSEAEQREKQYRIEDAVNAVKSALDEGIVIGGGLAFVRAAASVEKLLPLAADIDYRYGLEVLKNAILRPARQVIENTGENPDVILTTLKATAEGENAGWDAAKEEYVPDMIKAGIIDPLKVERVALEQAVSVVGNFIKTGAVVADEPEPEKKKETSQ